MFGLLQKILHPLCIVAMASVAPLVAWRRSDQGWHRHLVIAIHVIAVVTVLGLLIAAQLAWQLDTFVRSSLPLVRILWLPLVGGLVYATAWSAWFVARTLRKPAEQPLFDATTSCLRAGLDRFAQSGIDVSRTPLYLVLGSPAEGIRAFFAAAHADLIVLPHPDESDEPVQVCGNQDAIYVCCRDVSLLGRFARQATEARAEKQAAKSRPNTVASREPAHLWSGDQPPPERAQLSPAAAVAGHADHSRSTAGSTVSSPASATATATATATLVEDPPAGGDRATLQRMNQTISDLETLTVEPPAAATVEVLQPRHSPAPLLRLNSSEAEQLLERLDAVCQELAELRQPYCPINGVLLMVPLDAADDVETADHVGMRIERDLATITAATESSVSAQLIFCDLDRCEGSQAFLNRFPDTQRHRRLGANLPAPPPSEPDAGPQGIDHAVRWICDELFPPLGYRLMQRDPNDPACDRALSLENRQIHRLVDSMRQRREGMSRMLRRAVVAAIGRVRLRGCFITATGAAGHSRQAFAEGIVPLILDIQNEVQWSPERRRRDRWQHRAAMATYVAVAGAALLTVTWILGSL